MSLMIEKRQIVTPGNLLAEGDFNSGSNTYRDGDKIYASIVGLANYVGKSVYVVSLKGFYIPHVGDLIIGKILEVKLSNWLVDISSPYPAVLFASEVFDHRFRPSKDELTSMFEVGDLILAEIVSYDATRDPMLTVREPGLGKIMRGNILNITPSKIPRLIGRNGSMINLIKDETSCHITVGQNGLVLVSGKNPKCESLAILAIQTIEQKAHIKGLTDLISSLINNKKVEVTSNVD